MFVVSWAMVAAGFALEPLLALGPGFAALLTAEFAPLVIVGLVLFAGFRLARTVTRWVPWSAATHWLWMRVSVWWVEVLPWTGRIKEA